ncbi:hypothetical protein PAHAL_9G066800 [Panicum hallii]|uniref:Uncharacterized protein n=1 Tax=Panicum hallii TaxID=206008 RepID=A0A2T8I0C8_9POAL|nr:hypothetical protein PAHAL_9G066800 [Panicum hallii]
MGSGASCSPASPTRRSQGKFEEMKYNKNRCSKRYCLIKDDICRTKRKICRTKWEWINNLADIWAVVFKSIQKCRKKR